jgi:3-methylcrotonyl-CoA carboxylase beta subunit
MAKNQDLEFNINEDKIKQMVSTLNQKLEKVYEGGGKKALDKQREKGKLTARERIDFLLDKDKPSIEIGALVGEGMYTEHGGCPSGGVVVVIGYVSGKQCVVVANDASVKAGAWSYICKEKFKSSRNFDRKQNTHYLFG